MSEVRTRFAPSPTGFLHVGGLRTALFAWLVAKQANGKFLLRIEDTDRSRNVEKSEKHITDSLEWLGLKWDEGPFRQSERLEHYHQWAQKLVDGGRAYADERTPEELDRIRGEEAKAKRPVLFRNHRPKNPNKWQKGMPLRFKSEPKAYIWQDRVMGELKTGEEAVDDFILIKADGFPTYNFAHIIDDHLMKVSHVIRGQEFLSSVPNYLNLYEALSLEVPVLATMPHILASTGNKKLSKRDGAKDILAYQKEGYLPEAMLNFLASLGWNDGTEQEIFNVEELINKFSLDHVQKSGARFDEQRLAWVNGHFIRELNPDELYDKAASFWPVEAKDYEGEYKKVVLKLVQDRLKYLGELPELTIFFFKDLPVNIKLITGHKQLSKLSADELKSLLEQTKIELEASDFSPDDLQQRLNQLLESTKTKPVVLFSLIRIATTQAPASPDLAPSLAVLGKDKVLERINKQLEAL